MILLLQIIEMVLVLAVVRSRKGNGDKDVCCGGLLLCVQINEALFRLLQLLKERVILLLGDGPKTAVRFCDPALDLVKVGRKLKGS